MHFLLEKRLNMTLCVALCDKTARNRLTREEMCTLAKIDKVPLTGLHHKVHLNLDRDFLVKHKGPLKDLLCRDPWGARKQRCSYISL